MHVCYLQLHSLNTGFDLHLIFRDRSRRSQDKVLFNCFLEFVIQYMLNIPTWKNEELVSALISAIKFIISNLHKFIHSTILSKSQSCHLCILTTWFLN